MKEGSNHHTGAVRARSNVCLDVSEIHLIPGDILRAYALSLRDLTRQQKNELMYYVPCCICKRTVYVFMNEGCDYCASGGHGVPSVVEVRIRRDKKFRDEEARAAKEKSNG